MTVCIVFYPMLQPLLQEFLLACHVALHTVTAKVCGAHASWYLVGVAHTNISRAECTDPGRMLCASTV